MTEQNTLTQLSVLTKVKKAADKAWRDEVRRLAKTHSVRLIAKHAGVSHSAVWKIARQS